MSRLSVLVLALSLGGAPDHTVVTRDGKVHVGAVTREGTEVVVVTSKGVVRLPAVTVVADYVNLVEARAQCQARLDQAKKLYEEGSAKPENDALRRHLLSVSLDIGAETRDLIEILERRASPTESEALSKLKQTLFQFLRTVRDAKGATASAEGSAEAPIEKVALEGLGINIPPAPEGEGAAEITSDLGKGQASAVAELSAEQAGSRVKGALALVSPPAPHALAALSKAMSVETNRDALNAITAALSGLDLGPRLKPDFAWALTDTDQARRYAILALVRRLPARDASEYLCDCLRAKHPIDNRIRAAYASAFRKLKPRSVEELKDLLLKSKDRDVQLEAVRQLGMMRDRATLPALKVAIGGSRDLLTAAFNAIEKTGGPAVPLIMEMLGDGNDEVRRLARVLAQRITREEMAGVSELQKWYAQYKRHIDDDEAAFWKEQEEKDFPVNPEELRIFERKLPAAKQP